MLPATVGELERTLPERAADLALQPPGPRERVSTMVRNDSVRAAELIASWLLEQPGAEEGEQREAKAS